ncbi:MAG TPA: DUF72 domain-containing protein [Actinomycetota bacterium]|nr:DUF72 domain-containing protein [Actinomycetota bacterium]
MTALHVGCGGFPVEPAEYATQLSYVEIQETFHEGPELDAVKKDLERVAGDLRIGLVASKVITHPRKDGVYKKPGPDVPDHASVGHFTRSRWTDEAWERMDVLVRALKAAVVVLRTPPSFKKTPANALALENFIAHAERPGLEIVWEHGGTWPETDAAEVAHRLGLVIASDLTGTIPDGEVYARFTGGAKGTSALTDAAGAKAAQKLTGRNGFVVFANKSCWEDARRFSKTV